MPILIRDTPLRRATMNTSGISRMKPISKNSGMPTRNAASIIDQCTRSLPKARIRVRAIWSAPPESAISLPSMVPRARITPTKPSTPPKPSWKDLTIFSTGIPEVRPRKPAAMIRAMKGCTLKRVISTIRPMMVTRASRSR
ncbi:Uncharacterised protein [Klebsiella pneumoniae]|nr:Uncharacterised protein [Klebsiella pneumoniae]